MAHVIEHLLWAGEGRLGVDDPLRLPHGRQVTSKFLVVPKSLQRSEELQFAGVERLVELFEKQAAEQPRQHAHWQEETRPAGDPAAAIGRKSAASHDTVQMGMVQEILPLHMDLGKMLLLIFLLI